MTRQSRRVPIAQWLPRYDRSWLAPDVAAGLTLWGLVVPQGMAYAGIAGLPPQAGLYTLVASLLVYGLLGTSRHLSVQPTSATAALIASTVVAVGVSSDDAGGTWRQRVRSSSSSARSSSSPVPRASGSSASSSRVR